MRNERPLTAAFMSRIDKITSVQTLKIEGGIPYVVIFATGQVHGGRWSHAHLTGRIYPTPPEDGIFDLDFEGDPPEVFFPGPPSPIAVAVALPDPPPWVKGVRIHGRSNHIEASFTPISNPEMEIEPTMNILRDGNGGPWPGLY